MRKLIFCWTYVEWGGAQIYFLGIMKLASRSWDVRVLLPSSSDPKLLAFIQQAGVSYEFLDRAIETSSPTTIKGKLRRRLSIFLSEVEVFKRLLKFDLGSSVLHIEAAPWQSVSLLTALALRGANIFVTLHNALPEAPAWREMLWAFKIGIVSRLPRFHIFTSNVDTKNRFRRWVTDAFWKTITVTYTTVNPPEIESVLSSGDDKLELRKRICVDGHKFTVVALGQFIDRKGRWIYLEAAKMILSRSEDLQFIWMTASDVSSADLAGVESFGLGKNFHLVPAARVGTTRQEILGFYKVADVFALPSYVEGLPVALLEAMAMGVPSISTNVYAIPEAIRHEETGLLIESGSAAQLADAIERLKADAALRTRLGKAGRDHVVAAFDERIASQTAIDAYSKCFSV
jgi:glycosyltransferase involved in cell wall biosynthesis